MLNNIINKKFAIGFILLIITVFILGLYESHRVQNLLNTKPNKVYEVDTDMHKPQSQETNTVTRNKTDLKVVNQTENTDNIVLEKSESMQHSENDKVLENPIAIPKVKIADTVENTVNNSAITDTIPRKLTRKEMIDRAVAAGMPREQAEQMQPLNPGEFDKDVENTLGIIDALIDSIQSGDTLTDDIKTDK